MKGEFLLVTIIIIAIAIIYFFFSIWNVFITKKQTGLSVIDLGFVSIIEFFVIITIKLEMILIITLILSTWCMVIAIKTEKNYIEKEECV